MPKHDKRWDSGTDRPSRPARICTPPVQKREFDVPLASCTMLFMNDGTMESARKRLTATWAAQYRLEEEERTLLEAVMAGLRGQALKARLQAPIAELEMAFARKTGASVHSVVRDLLARAWTDPGRQPQADR